MVQTTPSAKPIELHYWPTPNGWKITIMLEECGGPYTVKFVNILKGEEFLAGDYSIADMACYPWTVSHERLGQTLSDFPQLKRWYDRIAVRAPVIRALKVGEEKRTAAVNIREDDEAQEILFGIPKRA